MNSIHRESARSATAERPPHPPPVSLAADSLLDQVYPGCWGQVRLHLTNPGSRPGYASVRVRAEGPLRVWRDRIDSYVPGGGTASILLGWTVSPRASAGRDHLVLASGSDHLRVPVTVSTRARPLPRQGLSVTATSSHSPLVPDYVLDGDVGTRWTSEYEPYAPLPQALTLELGGTYDVVALHYWPRVDDNTNGIATRYNVYASRDGQTFTQVGSGRWPFDHAVKVARFDAPATRAIRLECVEGGRDHVPREDGYFTTSEITTIVKSRPQEGKRHEG